MIIRQREVREWGARPHSYPLDIHRSHPQAQGLVGWWPYTFRGTSAKNLAGPGDGGVDQVLIGTTFDPVAGPMWLFVGVASITLTELPDYSGGPITVSFWMRSSSGEIDVILGFYSTAGGFNGFGVACNVNGGGKLNYWGGNGAGAWKDSATAYNDGNLYHAAITVEGTTVSFYKDGVLDGTAVGQEPAGAFTGTRSIGSDGSGALAHNGELTDIRIYNRALSPDAIWSMYDAKTRWDLYDSGAPAIWPVTLGGGVSAARSRTFIVM